MTAKSIATQHCCSQNPIGKRAAACKYKEKYIAIYTLGKPINLVKQARELAKKTGCKLLYLSDFYGDLDIKHLRGLGPLEFVSYLANAEYVFTNSFHGTAFSVNLHKNFFAEVNTLSATITEQRLF